MLAQLLAWIQGARWRRSLSHCLEGLAIQVPMTLVTANVWFGAASVVVWYWSRKTAETQFAAKGAASTITVWNVGLFPWQWDGWKVVDVLMPAASSFLLAACIAAVQL
ncbi:TPA: hypothetical protein QDB15_000716 [Burkholderia vietnamiensis]|uniref:hypothetical protein n=1 Tax=Burkholderia cepacia complex TaxID=87882 RepID=UPI001CF425E6|nr:MULTISPECIES: hypothetical protein [Burkholderia cepacia complex]MCA8156183.1 hypothetical protein [Burkholderia contaminans]MCA8207975.1 hypothetical protein [Burkholderia vietnamiensis]HDR9098349.1 hypothetical protein [Burkholderia vietnamiensis]HDR9116984.1 hypothetical protein [Burkholderia vietnamiensis]HDR9166293.1 hypothetical protein [Burkholderia vietnamiensis]